MCDSRLELEGYALDLDGSFVAEEFTERIRGSEGL